MVEDEEDEEFRYDWMRFAEMGPNSRIVMSSDLGSRDMDRNHDWINDAEQYYSSNDISKARDFVQQASSNGTNDANDNENIDELFDYESLNEKQKKIFNRVESHYKNVLTGIQVEALRIIVMGTAGTGKSYLIKAIRERLHVMAERSKDPVIVNAPTGVAAFNISGATIHSTLSIPIFNKKSYELDGNRLKQLQERLQNVIYIIIDEKSMVGRRMIGIIDIRLRQAFPESKDKPFGGRSIILFGDFGQLPPVLDLPMYANDKSGDEMSNNGIATYKQFREAYKLDVIQRQSGDSEKQ
jgi:hypothetical protein